MALWASILPAAATGMLAATLLWPLGAALALGSAAALVAAVVAAVHHAEVVAHRVGEPFGTLVLAVAITVIEVALIISMMLAGGPDKDQLARDTIYSALMIICTGVVGICILVGGLRHHEQSFRMEGANSALAALVALAGLVLVLPTFTTSSPVGTYTGSQLAFAAVTSLALWASFVFVQTIRHRDYFLPERGAGNEDAHAAPPSATMAWVSFGLLLLCLVVVVGLAKQLSPVIERAIDSIGAPKSVLGIAIALLVLLPETWAALRAARANRLQTSMNLALGSALASIGLTVPAVVVTAALLDLPLVLGLQAKELVLLSMTLLVCAITLGSGRTNVMQGAVHMVLFAAFLFLSLVP